MEYKFLSPVCGQCCGWELTTHSQPSLSSGDGPGSPTVLGSRPLTCFRQFIAAEATWYWSNPDCFLLWGHTCHIAKGRQDCWKYEATWVKGQTEKSWDTHILEGQTVPAACSCVNDTQAEKNRPAEHSQYPEFWQKDYCKPPEFSGGLLHSNRYWNRNLENQASIPASILILHF